MERFVRQMIMILLASLGLLANGTVWGQNIIIDTLTQQSIGILGSSYSSWEKSFNSDIVYNGNSGGEDNFQQNCFKIRTKNSNEGIVTTTEIGTINKICVKWHQQNTNDSRELMFYGKNTPYATPNDLFNNRERGTLLGELIWTRFDQDEELDLTLLQGTYSYIGIRSYQNAIYLDTIFIYWEVSSPLPITLLSFTVNTDPEGNLLEWVTATEEHNAGFKLQRSTDAIDWTDFAWVSTACGGNSIENTYYSFLDDNPPSDTTYYRFEQMDSTSYSATYYSDIVVAMRKPAVVKITPSAYYENGICLVGIDRICDAYIYYPDGRIRYDIRLKPYETRRLNIYGYYIIEMLWVENGDLQRKVFKVFSY